MANEYLKAAKAVARDINLLERTSERALDGGLAMIGRMLEARHSHNHAITFGASAITSATAAVHSIAQGLEHLAICHQQLIEVGNNVGIDSRMLGDECPIVTGQARPRLAAVA